MPGKRKQTRKTGGEEYRFKIDAWTPTRIPMLRLAEYMRELAQILGEPTQVHFRRLVPGSTVIIHEIEREAVPKVVERVSQVRQGAGPTEARRAFRSTNRMLREDNATGALRAGALVLPFPGRDEAQEEFPSVRQYGSIDGVVTSVSGKDQTAHIILLAEGKQISGFYTNRALAKQLAAKWDEPVRLFGRGRWRRDSEGNWFLIDFKVESFDELSDVPLTVALAELRAIPTEWGDDAYSELEAIRHKPTSKRNGGH